MVSGCLDHREQPSNNQDSPRWNLCERLLDIFFSLVVSFSLTKISCWDDMEVPEESFHWSSWDSRTCYPRRAFIQGLTDDQDVQRKKKRNESWLPSDPRNLSVRRLSLSSHHHFLVLLGFEPTLQKWWRERRKRGKQRKNKSITDWTLLPMESSPNESKEKIKPWEKRERHEINNET